MLGPIVRWLPVVVLCAGLLPASPASAADEAADAARWLARIRAAASERNYQGILVFSTAGVVSSSRIAHYRVGDQAFERIEALDGKQRKVYRHNEVVHTFWPQSKLAVIERHGVQTALPSAMQSVDPRILEQYEARAEPAERVAGREAVVLLLQPRDALRFAQRLWADQETGLMLRADIIDARRTVLESSAFSEVEIGVSAQPESVLQPIRQLDGWKVVRPALTTTRLESEGWVVARPVPGFRLSGCVRRPLDALFAGKGRPVGGDIVQAVYSDGLTHVSLFIEPFDAERHRRELRAQFGATHSQSQRVGDHWVTAMGDVPPGTLQQFVSALERRRP